MNKEAARLMSKVILSDKKVRIKLLGDSITHGVGGSGFAQNGGWIVNGFSRNPDGFCWAKLFKEHMETSYNCEVVNNACTGTNIQFIRSNFDLLVEEEDDIIICTIGTNNRHQYKSTGERVEKKAFMERFYFEILGLYETFRSHGKNVIFVANIPASEQNEMDGADYWRILHMNDIRNCYLKASAECGFPLVSMYDAFLDHCEAKNISVSSLLKDGLHPNDEGYQVMFDLIMKELGLRTAKF